MANPKFMSAMSCHPERSAAKSGSPATGLRRWGEKSKDLRLLLSSFRPDAVTLSSKFRLVILSEPGSPATGLRRWGGERGPWRTLQPRGPQRAVFALWGGAGGGEAKDPRLLLKKPAPKQSCHPGGSFSQCRVASE